MRQIYWSY